ncbi:MAG: 30S ribosomal protein S12 methylthiotransferase RimO [Nitrospira sp. CR1.2]|nr:30S ribosomal protein S12 methylthiotransferase RimO [Nitrospira sp. CR1.2]
MASSLITPSRAKRTKPTIGFVNLGCSKNQVDSEVMLGTLVAGGFQLTGDARAAEVVIINTCGFIEEAKQESINSIIEHGRLKKSGSCRVLIAAGCLAQRYQGELLKELPELDGVVGTGEFGRIADICRSLLAPKARQQRLWLGQPPYLYDAETPRIRLGTPHSAYLKIAEGCNRNCAFCAIPIMRGKQRSRPIDSIVAEAKRLGQEGVKELNLISQDTINYGVDLGLKQGLTALLRELVTVDEVRWIRPFYLYPQQVTDELLDLYAGAPRITKYLDMPLQHISDRMLKRMHRLGDRKRITNLVQRIRTKIPGVFFRTAFIVGFPGETDAMFEELRQFVLDMEFDRVAVFLYSDEEGTSAVDLDHKVEQAVMEERRNELLALQESISESKNREYLGRTIEVLVDGVSEESDQLLEARHEGLAPEIDGVVYCERGIAQPGDVVSVTVSDVAGYDLIAHPTNQTETRATFTATSTLLMPKKSGTGYR